MMASARPNNIRAVDSKPTADTGPKKPTKGGDRERKSGALAQIVRKHPAATLAAALGIGVLLPLVLPGALSLPAAGPKTKNRKARPKESPPNESPDDSPTNESPDDSAPDVPRTHHFGAADMEFNSSHPDGKTVNFKFAWKKRPIDAPEKDWPADQMGFRAIRPDGKHTTFKFEGKTRPIPDTETAVGDNRPGLGWARMDFTSSAPGRDDFTFTWNRTPAGQELRTDLPPGKDPRGAAKRPATTTPVKKAVVKQPPSKKGSVKKDSGKQKPAKQNSAKAASQRETG